MPIRPPYITNGPTTAQMLTDMPEREVFVKDTNDSIIGTGMRLLPDGSLLAPEGFSVESGSIDFGDVITLSEAAGFLALKNNLNDVQYQVVDYRVPRTGPSISPRYFKILEAEVPVVAQADDTQILTANPLSFNYTTLLNARTNSIKFKANTAMSNVRIRIVKTDVDVTIKYLPSKAAWLTNSGGYNFVIGDNEIDFGDSPVPLSSGTTLTFEIKSSNISLKGNSSGVPYFSVLAQQGEYTTISDELSPEDIKSSLETLVSPNKLSKSAIQDAVTSINAQFGDVVLDWEDVGAQEASETLEQISGLTLSPDKLIHTNSNSEIDLIPISVAGVDWLTLTNADNQKIQLGLSEVASSGSYSDLLDVPLSFVPEAHTHVVTDITDFPALSSVATSGSYNDLSNKPVIRRIETYNGTTNASGNYTVTYGTAFSVIPDVQPFLQAGLHSQTVTITSSTTTGFTINVVNRSSVTLLAVEVLLASTTPVNGASVGVLVTERI